MNLDREINAMMRTQGERGVLDCALMGRKVSPTECSSRSVNASSEDFKVCCACSQGKKLAAAASPLSHLPPWPEHLGPAIGPPATVDHCSCIIPDGLKAAAADAAQEPAPPAGEPKIGWELVREVTGIGSHSKLAKMINRTQPNVSKVFRLVAEGEVPQGPTVQEILDYAHITMEQLLGRPVPVKAPKKPKAAPKRKTPKAAPPPAAPAVNAADLDVAMSHAEPGTLSEADLQAAREPADIPPPVCQPGLAGASLEALLGELRNRLPWVSVSVNLNW